MRKEKFKEFVKEGRPRGERYRGKDRSSQHGPKTFRRGRAIAFLEMLNVKRSTIKQQLELPEFEPIQQILVGELKAIDMVMNEFVQLFDLYETEEQEHGKEEVPEENEK